jgi:hypothetical protein
MSPESLRLGGKHGIVAPMAFLAAAAQADIRNEPKFLKSQSET